MNLPDIRTYFREKHLRPPSHEKAAMVDEIIKLAGFTEKYSFMYWLGLLKRSGVRYPEMMGILDNVRKADPKYNKGALLTLQLTKIARSKKTQKLL